MIELTQADPHSHRIESQRVYVMLDQITHVSEYETRGQVYGLVHLVNGKQVIVHESVDTISTRIRDYAETAQRERITKIVADEIAKQFPEMAGKAWRYDESNR